MSYGRRHSSISVHPNRLSYLPWDEAPICASPDNVSPELKSEIALATDTSLDVNTRPKPTRPARHPSRPTPLRIVPKSPPPSFDPLPFSTPISISHKDPSERIIWLSPSSPSSIPSFPPFQSSFLDRIPKPISIEDDFPSTLSSTTCRLPSVPPLRSYKRPSTAPSRELSDKIHSLPTKLSRHDLLSTNAGAQAVEDSPPRSHFVNLTTDDKKTVLSPLSFMRMRTASEASFSSPLTTSTLTSESVLSFIVDENTAEMAFEIDSAVKAKRALFWKSKNNSRAQVNLEVYEVLPEPKPSFLIASSGASSMPELGAPPSALRLEIGSDEDEDIKTGEGGLDSIRCKTRGVMRRVWRRLVGGQ